MDRQTIEQLERYRDAVRAMREGQFQGLALPASGTDGAVAALGQDLALLGTWLDQRFAEFRKLQEVTLEIGGGLFIDNVLDRIYDAFDTLIPYDRIGCALLSDDTQVLRSHWARANYDGMRINRGFSARLTGSSLNTVLTSGKPRILNDLEAYLFEHPNSVSTQLIVAEGIRSSLTCPLVASGKPVGFLFFSSRDKNVYRDLHHELFMQIAAQVSMLIEKSLLYQQLFDLNQQLKEQALRDVLTGVFNRGAIFEHLTSRLSQAQRKGRPISVIMADIDHFKDVNDTHGHLAGDAALRAVASAIQQALRDYDQIGRYGGEEFLIVLDDTPLDDAKVIAERVRAAIETLEVSHGPLILRTSLSLGLAQAAEGERPEALIARADAALYAAKEGGRNRCCQAAALPPSP